MTLCTSEHLRELAGNGLSSPAIDKLRCDAMLDAADEIERCHREICDMGKLEGGLQQEVKQLRGQLDELRNVSRELAEENRRLRLEK